MADENKIIPALLEIQNQVLVWHWQTRSHAQHLALGDFYESFGKLTDRFVESYQGKNNNRLQIVNSTFNIRNYEKGDFIINTWIPAAIKVLTSGLEPYLSNDVGLMAIRDEMVAELEKLRYLFSLE